MKQNLMEKRGLRLGKPKTSQGRAIKILTLDTETDGLFGPIKRIGVFDGTRYYTGTRVCDVTHVFTYYSMDYDVHVYVHNLDYDIAKMAKEFVQGQRLDRSIFINNNVAVYTTTVNNDMNADGLDIRPCPIVFHDSMKILQGSLEANCRDWGLKDDEGKVDILQHIDDLGWTVYDERGDVDVEATKDYYFQHVDPDEPEYNHYLEFDCRSLYTLIDRVMALSGLPAEDFIACPTIASLAMKVFKTRFPDDYETACSSHYLSKWGQMAEAIIREAYFGGRTEVFVPRLFDGYHYDVNSLYPSVMKAHEYPVGKYFVVQGARAEKCFDAWLTFHAGNGIMECDVFVPDQFYPPLPYKKVLKRSTERGKLLFPVGHLSGTWTFPELEHAIDCGARIHTVKQVIYWPRTEAVFKEYVETFEAMKKGSKGAKKQFAKIMLNSLYGKFGMQRLRESLLPESYKALCEEQDVFYMEREHFLLDEKMVWTDVYSNSKYIQVHLACFVTSYARIVLHQALIEETSGQKFYCDTDSVVSQNTFHDDLVDPDEFGKWDLENVVKKGIYLQPKLYYEKTVKDEYGTIGGARYESRHYGEVKRAKGITKKTMSKFTEQTYDSILEAILRGDQTIELEAPHDARRKFVSCLKEDRDFDERRSVRKMLFLNQEQKRVMDYAGNTSRPHVITDWGAKS